MERPAGRYISTSVMRGFCTVFGVFLYPLFSAVIPVGALPVLGAFSYSAAVIPIAAAAWTVLGALLIDRMALLSRGMLTLSIVGIAAATVHHLGMSPSTVFPTLLVVILATALIWYSRSLHRLPERARRFDPAVLEMRAASVGALVLWGVQSGTGLLEPVRFRASLIAGYGLLLYLGAHGLKRSENALRLPKPWIGAAAAAATSLTAITWSMSTTSTTWLTIVPIFGLFALRHSGKTRFRHRMRWWEELLAEPYRLLFFSFLATCLAGGFLLALPVSGTTGAHMAVMDALFTAVSATCVTGLSTVDTATDFSLFGQWIILLLIQIGGLGIMTFSTAAILALGKRLSIRYEGAMSQVLGETEGLSVAVRKILGITLIAEITGAIALFLLFLRAGDRVGTAAFRGLFTAVSAYCNAGFSLQSESLIPYQHHPTVLHIIAILIIVGSIGPFAVVTLPGIFRGRPPAVQHRIVLTATALLLAIPALFLTAVEWSNTLGDLSAWERITNGWFLAVTPRTAGFNSVDTAALRPVSRLVTEVLMFIGGSPGSTAGGVKTTAAALLVLSVAAALRGREGISVYGRRIAYRSVLKAVAIVVVAAGAAIAATATLLLTQEISFEVAAFEALSALGTVGLSVGGTGALDEIGKGIVMVLMFAGRLGPLSLFLLLGADSTPEKWRYPEQEVFTG